VIDAALETHLTSAIVASTPKLLLVAQVVFADSALERGSTGAAISRHFPAVTSLHRKRVDTGVLLNVQLCSFCQINFACFIFAALEVFHEREKVQDTRNA
jgi:hypothetical protein